MYARTVTPPEHIFATATRHTYETQKTPIIRNYRYRHKHCWLSWVRSLSGESSVWSCRETCRTRFWRQWPAWQKRFALHNANGERWWSSGGWKWLQWLSWGKQPLRLLGRGVQRWPSAGRSTEQFHVWGWWHCCPPGGRPGRGRSPLGLRGGRATPTTEQVEGAWYPQPEKLVFLSLDLETGGESCGIIQLSAEIVRFEMERVGKSSKNIWSQKLSEGKGPTTNSPPRGGDLQQVRQSRGGRRVEGGRARLRPNSVESLHTICAGYRTSMVFILRLRGAPRVQGRGGLRCRLQRCDLGHEVDMEALSVAWCHVQAAAEGEVVPWSACGYRVSRKSPRL